MITKIDSFLASKQNVVAFVSVCVLLATIYSFAFQAISARAATAQAEKDLQQAKARTAAVQRDAWAQHLRREAWNRAHSSIIAARRAAALKAARAQAAQEEAARAAFPYVASKDRADMWASEDDMCNGFLASAQAIVNAQRSGSDLNTQDVVDSLPGHSYLENGTHVSVVDHETWQCPDSDTTFNMTKIRTSSGDSGYIQEGGLSKS